MSIGNLKTDGGKGTNWPWQYKMLKGLQGIIDAINITADGTEYEAKIVSITCPGPTPFAGTELYLEVRVWDTENGGWTGPPTYYLPGSNVGVPLADFTAGGCDITYLEAGDATEATLQAILDELELIEAGTAAALGQTTMTASVPVVVASDQTDIGVDINSPIGQLDDNNSVSVTISRDQFAPELLTAMFRVSVAGLNTLPLTTRSCSFANVGANDAEVLGATLKTGETVSFDSGGFGGTLSRSAGNAVNYNCLTSELLIIVVSE